MGGYGDRSAPANTIHDPLYAHALAFGTREQPLVIIVCDLVGIDETMAHELRQRVTEQFPETSVWLGATHTHSGPDAARALSFLREQPDPVIRERIIAGASSAAQSALTRMHPVWVKRASGAVNGIATNRDHPDDSADLALDMLCFYDTDEPQVQPAAVFASFPCHPTVLGATNLALSADLPGAYRRQLHALLGEDIWLGLATGAAGDISTRHMRQGQGFDELERLGKLLAQQAYTLLSTAQPLKLDLPQVCDAVVTLEPKEALAPNELTAYVQSVQAHVQAERQAGNIAQARTQETVLQGLQAAQHRTPAQEEQARDVTVSVAILGACALVAVPGELYNNLGTQIKRNSERFVLLLGYTNGYVGYLPTRAAYKQMDYEVLMSPFAPGSGEQLVNALETLLRQA
jgi:hypothetical protein